MIVRFVIAIRQQVGQSLAEYGLIIALIAVIAIVALGALGVSIKGQLDAITDAMKSGS